MAGEYKVNLKITNPDGQEHITEDAFTFDPAPVAYSITPNGGPASGGTVVEISADYVDQGAKIFFGDKEATNVNISNDGKTVTCKTPNMEA